MTNQPITPLYLAQAVRALLPADDEPSVDMTINRVRLSLRRLRHTAKPTWYATVWSAETCRDPREAAGGTASEALDNLIGELQRGHDELVDWREENGKGVSVDTPRATFEAVSGDRNA